MCVGVGVCVCFFYGFSMNFLGFAWVLWVFYDFCGFSIWMFKRFLESLQTVIPQRPFFRSREPFETRRRA